METVTIQGYGTHGEGVTHLDNGMTCFVSNALVGEVCRIQIDHVGKSAAWGHVEKILKSSPARLASDCPYYESCGGCSLRHMTYTEELSLKRQKIEDCLKRIGGLDLPLSDIYGAKSIQRYRNKVQFPVSNGKIGFYAARSHRVTDVEDCLLQPENAARLRKALQHYLQRYAVSSYDERSGKGLLRHLYVRTARSGESLCCLLVNGKRLPHEDKLVAMLREAEPGLQGVVLGVNQARNNVILGDSYRTLWGKDSLTDVLCGLEFQISAPSFYQVNPVQTERLYELVMEYAGLTGTETVWDLYCGIGTITLCLARKAARVIGTEVVPEAIADARKNASRNHITNADFFCGDALKTTAHLASLSMRPDVVTVDPPRKGLAPEVPGLLASMQPGRIVYVSCDPATLARDLKQFSMLGYFPRKTAAVDLFPRTPHVETVVQLSQKELKS